MDSPKSVTSTEGQELTVQTLSKKYHSKLLSRESRKPYITIERNPETYNCGQVLEDVHKDYFTSNAVTLILSNEEDESESSSPKLLSKKYSSRIK